MPKPFFSTKQYLIFIFVVLQGKFGLTEAMMLLQPFLNLNTQAASMTLTNAGLALSTSEAIQNLTFREAGKLAFTPILGLKISLQYLWFGYKTGQLNEKAVILLSLLGASIHSVAFGSIDRNAQVGVIVGSQIHDMIKVLSTKGGCIMNSAQAYFSNSC